jgi:hypothetical protein
MSSILKVDTIQDQSGNNIINENADTITIGASGDTITIPAGATLSNLGTASGFGLTWQSVQTTGFTAVKGNAYPCDTTSAGFTVTLPATPSAGDQVQLVDYAGTFDTNALTIDPNGEDIEGQANNLLLTGEREGVILTYIDSTQGWIATSGINEGTDALEPTTYSADFLVIAGGGGGAWGGGGAGGYRNSYSTEPSGGGGSSEASLTFDKGIVYTITVGGGGAGGVSVPNPIGSSGINSSISGTGITTITSDGGGAGADDGAVGVSGGSGGGAANGNGAGSGTANQGFAGAAFAPGTTSGGSGGGGANSVGSNGGTGVIAGGGNGGSGLSSSITGSSTGRAGGGGGGGRNDPNSGTTNGGTASDGGGAGGTATSNGTAGTVNTGGGGGGGGFNGSGKNGAAGGKGVVILRMPTAKYSATTTGSPTVGTDGTDTILTFNDSGSYTG